MVLDANTYLSSLGIDVTDATLAQEREELELIETVLQAFGAPL